MHANPHTQKKYKKYTKCILKCDGNFKLWISVCSCCVQTLHRLPQGASASTGSGGGEDSCRGGWGKTVTVVNGPSEDVSLELEESVFRTATASPGAFPVPSFPHSSELILPVTSSWHVTCESRHGTYLGWTYLPSRWFSNLWSQRFLLRTTHNEQTHGSSD